MRGGRDGALLMNGTYRVTILATAAFVNKHLQLAKEETEESDAESEYQKTTQENKITVTLKDQAIRWSRLGLANLTCFISQLAARLLHPRFAA